MAIQLTPEQEQRLQAIVATGAYPSVKDALDAAVTAVEVAPAPGFEGTLEELEELILEGLNSGEPVPYDEAFRQILISQTDQMIADHIARKSSKK